MKYMHTYIHIPDCYSMKFTTFLISNLTDLRWNVNLCLLDDLSLYFATATLTRESDGFVLASTIILVLQANRLTKCSSHYLANLNHYKHLN